MKSVMGGVFHKGNEDGCYETVPVKIMADGFLWERFKAVCSFYQAKPGAVLNNMMMQYIEGAVDNGDLSINDVGVIIPAGVDPEEYLCKEEADCLDDDLWGP
jgi:hypothetical protein